MIISNYLVQFLPYSNDYIMNKQVNIIHDDSNNS
jgi:hypothetical protein